MYLTSCIFPTQHDASHQHWPTQGQQHSYTCTICWIFKGSEEHSKINI